MGLPARVAMATMHGKEQVLAPALAAIGVELVMPKALDTDQFGTFTRDRPRQGTMVDAARAKAEAAMRETGLSAALASEGSYGPHPTCPSSPPGANCCCSSIALRGFAVTEMTIDERPTFDHCTVGSFEEAHGFLERIGFPEQGVVVAPGGRPTNRSPRGYAICRAFEPRSRWRGSDPTRRGPCRNRHARLHEPAAPGRHCCARTPTCGAALDRLPLMRRGRVGPNQNRGRTGLQPVWRADLATAPRHLWLRRVRSGGERGKISGEHGRPGILPSLQSLTPGQRQSESLGIDVNRS